ncbi:MAG TPA: hypothetical protein VJW20_24785 [Candidatus Angelobacter sp.]|nr:hypothetical protein [Candidatus Angelobacter sp.]
MSDQNDERKFDDLLDSALASYSAVEPRPGLESRILARIQDAAEQQQDRWWSTRWLWAGTAIAALIVVIALLVVRHGVIAPQEKVIVRTPPAQAQPQPQPAVQNGGQEKVTKHVTAPRRHTAEIQNASLPLDQRPQVFPTPTPLSEQERLLLSYYARTPREELIAQSHPDDSPLIGASDSDSDIAVPDLTFVPQKSSNTR